MAHWLNELRGMLGLGMVAAGVGAVASSVATLSGQPIEVPIAVGEAVRPETLTGVPPGVRLGSSLDMVVEEPSVTQRALELAATLPRIALITVVLALLWRAVRQASHDDPFRSALAMRLRTLGILLITGGPAVWVAESVARYALSSTVGFGGTYAVVDFLVPLAWLFFGIAVLAVGEIVRRGQAMRADLDGVV
ncbi:DUF2975 domain-containing protein [Actinoplanes utahensis]|uniref:DUF2975 domain-containing protein n=1 Tax=Actinoplanes utahensis TaxID=1869 RepID=A0A0A6UJ38_ACTUT|nr:DUF2975 domain-containing protein [Actinoplanes utahensis]KHD75098.1 hypothetical protein MB27_24490 [Actinoplanes utahensis]GIF27021.1 hypothetical protein Aut01nite_00070 [Actinoplanes utahensis]